MDLTFCGVYVVTVSLYKIGTILAAALGADEPSGFFTVIAGGWAYSIPTADLLATDAL